MNCMYRIFRQQAFWCRWGDNPTPCPLPLPAQAELRHIARRAMESHQIEALKEIETCLEKQKVPPASERLALWASLWLLMLICGDSLMGLELYQDTGDLMSERDDQERRKTAVEQLLKTVAVFYGGVFRSKKHLQELSMGHSICSPYLQPQDQEYLSWSFRQAEYHRSSFCKQLQDFPSFVFRSP